MALPNKKQLNKHKRGTRKALDTLDAIENLEEELFSDTDTDSVIDNSSEKKAKKTKAASKKNKKANPQSVKKKAVKSLDLELDPEESKSTAESSPPLEPPSEHNEMTGETISISAESVSEEKAEAPQKEIALTDTSQPVEPSMEKKMENQSPKSPAGTSERNQPIGADKAAEPPVQQPTSPEEDDENELIEDTLRDRYLTFKIGLEDYAIEIRFVTEIIVVQKITEVPETPPHIRGVINLRGMVIPVMDVRQRFNLEPRDYDERTCIIVVDFEGLAVGLIVDVVNEVVDIPEKNVDPPPAAHSAIQLNYISGMGRIGKKVKIILDIERVLDRKNVAQIEE